MKIESKHLHFALSKRGLGKMGFKSLKNQRVTKPVLGNVTSFKRDCDSAVNFSTALSNLSLGNMTSFKRDCNF
ncbi:hypothetical protein [Thermodesulfovibrio aggregans]|uniref:hypothetical protein n=1 Tax=Thermodesulfovibrio aggregans TaxID=86166 RepID=UPI000AB0BA9B|nr:hypothetical protein [Thermodesulfovibrio aggregans]